MLSASLLGRLAPALLAAALLTSCQETETESAPCVGPSCTGGAGGQAGAGGHGGSGGDAAARPGVLVVGADGEIAAIERDDPWPVVATGALGLPARSARYHAGRYFVVHPAPADRISVLAAADLSVQETVDLEPGADPQDIAFVGDGTAVVSQRARAALVKLELASGQRTEIDLAAFADADGIPDAAMLASCGARLFVQLQRIDHTAQPAPASTAPVLAVVDVAPSGDQLVDADPTTPGIQGIALGGPPDFDMQVDCSRGTLYVAEPVPLALGGGGFEEVQLDTLTASPYPIADLFGEVGGFRFTAPDAWWVIVHTEFGPAPSSHLNRFSPSSPPHSAWDTFAPVHIDNLAHEAATEQLYFPDGCTSACAATDRSGVQVFDAGTAERLTEQAVDVGFAPIEVVIAREP